MYMYIYIAICPNREKCNCLSDANAGNCALRCLFPSSIKKEKKKNSYKNGRGLGYIHLSANPPVNRWIRKARKRYNE